MANVKIDDLTDAASLAVRIAALPRGELIRVLRDLPCSFQLDFTEEFLNSISIERLRHIILAAGLHAIESRSGHAA